MEPTFCISPAVLPHGHRGRQLRGHWAERDGGATSGGGRPSHYGAASGGGCSSLAIQVGTEHQARRQRLAI